MNMTEFNPFVRYVDRRISLYTGPDDLYAYDYRIFYVERSSMQMWINGEQKTLFQNDLVIIPPGTGYRRTDNEAATTYIINFDLCFENPEQNPIRPDTKARFDESRILSKTTWDLFPLVLHCDERTAEQFEQIFDIYIEKQEYWQDRIAAMLKTVVINGILHTHQDRTPELVKNVKQYIEKHFSENITNREFGEAFSYHPNYISRIFKESTGETLHSYIIEIKLKKALRMILEGSLKITEISENCGFSSYPYFIKCFREKYGASPLKYRNQRNKLL